MTRLTARNKDGTAYFPECFKEPCYGFGCQKEEACKFMEAVCEKLAVFEDIQELVSNNYKFTKGSEQYGNLELHDHSRRIQDSV